ncbi:MAG: TerB family tellurite resistance protein [Mariprofundaceae bacterium]|nr:TerB family tellurite resistance protein [Mariprofundaceae bacterium]
MIFDTLKKLFSTAEKQDSTSNKDENKDIALAVTAIMLEIMYIDDKHEISEQQHIIAAITKRFQLEHDEMEILMRDAKVAQHQATDFHQFTSRIQEHYNTEERIEFLQELWSIAMVDGHIDPYEEQLIRRIANLIGVYHGEFIQAKIQAKRQLPPTSPL